MSEEYVSSDNVREEVKQYVFNHAWESASQIARENDRKDLIKYISFCQRAHTTKSYQKMMLEMDRQTEPVLIQDSVEFVITDLINTKLLEAVEVYASWIDIFDEETRNSITSVVMRAFESNKVSMQEAKECEHLLETVLQRMGMNETTPDSPTWWDYVDRSLEEMSQMVKN
jgi:alpha-L-fucosidase